MKTFLFDTFNRYKRFSESLDVKIVLCNKAWFVFNNSGLRETYIFQENGKLKISLNGKVTHATWEYIPVNKSLIISGNEQSYMVHAAYVDNILLALQIDGTKEYAFLIDENNKQDFLPQSYNDIKRYFQIKEEKQIQKEEAERKEKEFKQLEYVRLAEQKRIEEKKQENEQTIKNNALKESKLYQTTKMVIWIITILCPISLIFYTIHSGESPNIVDIIMTCLCFVFAIPLILSIFILLPMQDKIIERYKRKHKL